MDFLDRQGPAPLAQNGKNGLSRNAHPARFSPQLFSQGGQFRGMMLAGSSFHEKAAIRGRTARQANETMNNPMQVTTIIGPQGTSRCQEATVPPTAPTRPIKRLSRIC